MASRQVVIAIAVAALVTSSFAAIAGATTSILVVNGNGLNQLHLRTDESTAVATLTRLLGPPNRNVDPTPNLSNCGVAATASWHSLGAYFNHGRLVGLSFGPAHDPEVRTGAGLVLGDTLRRARSIYSRTLTTSGNNGGSWFVTTSRGRLDGFLSPSTGRAITPAAKIATIDVGVVGCPAMSP